MELTQDDVIRILKLIDESPMGRVSLQVGDLKLEVDKGEGPGSGPGFFARTPSAEPPVPPVTVKTEAPSAGQAALPGDEHLLAIKAPLLGIFYRRPQPGAPTYVEEGALVDENTTVALIEVMKLFNPVKAGVKGRIRRICAENNALVEYGQVLFLVAPE